MVAIVFLNFLRGMETGVDALGGGKSMAFLNFLRGMETVATMFRIPRPDRLPKLP